MTPPRVLTIAGSDSSAAAGAQADLKTIAARGAYGLCALTMLTAQNSTGIQAIQRIPTEFIAQQIDSILTDIGADAVKTGLLLLAPTVQLVADKVEQYHLKTLVVDPVLIDGAGRQLVDAATIRAYTDQLFPLATVVTPNLGEAAILVGHSIHTLAEMREAAVQIATYGSRWVVIKGGHAESQPGDQSVDGALSGAQVVDVLYDRETGQFYEFYTPRLPIANARGAGCTFASAIASELAKGQPIPAAVEIAKRFVFEALQASANWKLGEGRGTLQHAYRLAGSL